MPSAGVRRGSTLVEVGGNGAAVEVEPARDLHLPDDFAGQLAHPVVAVLPTLPRSSPSVRRAE